MYQRALVSVAKGTEAIAYIGAFGIVAFGNNGICLHSGKCQKRQRIAGNREKGIWDSGESHSAYNERSSQQMQPQSDVIVTAKEVWKP